MKVSFSHITLVHSKPKYVNAKLKAECSCGTAYPSQKVDRYARIHVECTTCKEKKTIRLNRETLVRYYLYRYPGLVMGLIEFLKRWEKEM